MKYMRDQEMIKRVKIEKQHLLHKIVFNFSPRSPFCSQVDVISKRGTPMILHIKSDVHHEDHSAF